MHESRLAKTRTCGRRQCCNQLIVVPGKKYCSERCKKAAGSARRGEGPRESKWEAVESTISFSLKKIRESAHYHASRFGMDPEEVFDLLLEELDDRLESVFEARREASPLG